MLSAAAADDDDVIDTIP